MDKHPKVLITSPIYERMDYCLDKFIEALKSIGYKEYENRPI